MRHLLCLICALLAFAAVAEEQREYPLPVDHVALQKAIREAPAKLVVVNVWATWCIPCRLEFPHFVKLRNTYKDQGVEVFFVSGDFHDEIDATRKFLKQQKVDWVSFLKDGPDAPFIDSLHPDWAGALPATFVYDKDGKLLNWWAEAVDYETLEKRVKALLPEKG